MVVQNAVGVDHFPDHFNQIDAFLRRVIVLDDAGEAQQMRRIRGALLGRLHERRRLALGKAEPAGDDEWAEGLYFRVYGPVNWTKWDARFCVADPTTVTTSSCSTGYFTSTGSEVLLDSIADYFKGESPAPVDSITFKGLKFAKMPS